MTGPSPSARSLASTYLRMFAIQGSWNYETLIGNGIGFAVEPALRALPGGVGSKDYRAALGRQSRYFNAHPYLASVAVGALARAELDHTDPVVIERFRTALCGPLGSLGDQLVWSAWLPFSSFVALAAFGAGAGPLVVALTFLLVYNAGHFALRAWGLWAGLRHGIRVASALNTPVLRDGPRWIASAATVVAGFAIPLAALRVIGDVRWTGAALVVVALATLGAGRLARRAQGWRVALALLALLILAQVAT